MPKGIDSKILRKLDEWQEKVEAPPELVEFYRRLLCIQSRVEQQVGMPRPSLSSEAIRTRLEQGLPLIEFDELDLDWSLLQDVFVEVTSVFARYPGLFNPSPRSIVKVGVSHLHLREAVKAWYEETRLQAMMVADDVNEYLLEDIIRATLKPFLTGYAKALLNCVNQERWRRGYCPICGGNPDFSFLDKERGARWLLCSRCDTEWLFQRLECPYCSNRDQNEITYFAGDDGLYRLYVCERCKRYLKTIDLRQAKEEVMMPLERLFTLSIDAQAWQYGYGYSDEPDTLRS